MTTNEAYYLVLVCGAFVAFAAGMALAYVEYRRWLQQQPQAAE
ncbi:MAG: hypothetical protein AB7F22_29055 [Reyranella sp.]